MKTLKATFLAITLSSCSNSLSTEADEFIDTSFSLCSTKVKAFSKSMDGKIRVLCDNESFFLLRNQTVLDDVNELNSAYCQGAGLTSFIERNEYWTFTCKGERQFNVPKP